MKLGIFDSGLGGLILAKAIRDSLPDLDIAYVGDTLHLPYGNRSQEAITMYTKRAMQHMFEDLDCQLIILACNSASTAALRKLQQEWLPEHYPERNILGVVVPTIEAAVDKGYKNLGLIATNYIINSDVYREELEKLNPDIAIVQQSTPLLVPLIENEGLEWADQILKHYLEPLNRAGIECLLLGCTHYPFLKEQIRDILGSDFAILSQDEIIPEKLANYLQRHPEHAEPINKSSTIDFYVSDLTDNYIRSAQGIYGQSINIQKTEF